MVQEVLIEHNRATMKQNNDNSSIMISVGFNWN